MNFGANVVFSDEKTFCSSTHGPLHCYREKDTSYEPNNIFEAHNSGHFSCNFWGCMSLNGLGELAHIEGRLDSNKYIDTLERHLSSSIPMLSLLNSDRFIYVQDNCSVHKSRIVTEWFNAQEQIQVMDWPPKAADLNPIENVWGLIVNCWESFEGRTQRNLIDHTLRSWESLQNQPDIIFSMVESMPRRLQEVIEREGGWTSY